MEDALLPDGIASGQISRRGVGAGAALEALREHAPAARIEPPFIMEADQERPTLNQIEAWLRQTDN
jgi:hypothetical protein